MPASGDSTFHPTSQNPNPRGSRSRGGPANGTFRVVKRELLDTVKTTTNQYIASVILHPDKLPWLGALAKGFDRIKWHRAKIIWRPSVGAMESGSIAIGIDWDSNAAALDYKNTVALTPVMDSPVWQSTTLPLPSGKLQTRKEYHIRKDTNESDYDKAPGYALIVTEGAKQNTTIGHVWLEYDVSLFGTVLPKA